MCSILQKMGLGKGLVNSYHSTMPKGLHVVMLPGGKGEQIRVCYRLCYSLKVAYIHVHIYIYKRPCKKT